MKIEQQVFELIKQDKSIKEIKNILNITDFQILESLKKIKEQGYKTYPEIFLDGDVLYHINKTLNQNKIELNINEKQIITILAISDIHFGSNYERIDLLDKVYEYAIKNDINIILNLGDLIHGRESKISIQEQLEKVIKEYPYDKNIKNIILLGNHDFHSLHYDGYDIGIYLFNERTDFINAGYGTGYIDVINDRIGLFHDLSVVKNPSKEIDTILDLHGHSHYYKITTGSVLKVNVPSLSDLSFSDKKTVPGFLKIELIIDNNRIEKINIKNKVFFDSIITIGELKYSVPVLKKKK